MNGRQGDINAMQPSMGNNFVSNGKQSAFGVSQLELQSYPNNQTNYTTVNSYTMPTVMFNEPHIPILLPTSANYMGDFESFRTILDNVQKAQKIGKLLDEEEAKLKLVEEGNMKQVRWSNSLRKDGSMKFGWDESLSSLIALKESENLVDSDSHR